MRRKLTIVWAAVLIAAAVPAKCTVAAESKPAAEPAVEQEAKPEVKQEKPQASPSAAVPGTPLPAPGVSAIPASGEPKIETLDLSAAVKEISQQDPRGVVDLYRVVGDIYTRTQKPNKAVSLLETYRRQGGVDQSLLSNLANLHMQRGAVKEAVEIFEKLIALYPQDMGPTMMLANLYRRNGDSKKEIALLESSAKANPKNPESFMQLANAYRGQSNWAKAEEAVKKAIEVQPQFWYYQQLAQLSLQQDKLDKALAVLEEAIKKLPGSEVDLTLSMSDMCLQKGQKEKAEKILNGLLEKVSEPWRKNDIRMRLQRITPKVEAAATPVPAAAPAVPTEPATVISTAVTGKQ